MQETLLCIWSIANADWYSGFNKKNKTKKFEDGIILCIKFQRHTILTFSFMLYLISYSCTASFYHNVINAQWQRQIKTSETKTTVGLLE